jgi:hypothetical protein
MSEYAEHKKTRTVQSGFFSKQYRLWMYRINKVRDIRF